MVVLSDTFSNARFLWSIPLFFSVVKTFPFKLHSYFPISAKPCPGVPFGGYLFFLSWICCILIACISVKLFPFFASFLVPFPVSPESEFTNLPPFLNCGSTWDWHWDPSFSWPFQIPLLPSPFPDSFRYWVPTPNEKLPSRRPPFFKLVFLPDSLNTPYLSF